MSTKDYKVTIGIECHVQLKTKTKLFSAVDNDARNATPNTLISHIDLGMPGALPVLNETAVVLATRAAFALRTDPQKLSRFDRKHYFYPDLPMGYQITQFYDPIIKGGEVTIIVNGETKTVGIHEAHLEADAGKSIHPLGKDYSLVDLNRAGTPLLEIVSNPDLHSPQEARSYARELYLLMRYADVSEANLYYGNMRFDVNVSVSKTNELGTRTETKNLNSFRSVEKAAEYEIKRQIGLLEKGQDVIQETRGWDDVKMCTTSQRSKEEAHDYRYMPDPDLPPVILDDKFIEKVKKSMPILPGDLRTKLTQVGIDTDSIETLVDEPVAGRFIADVMRHGDKESVQKIVNWLIVDIQASVNSGERKWSELRLNHEQFFDLVDMVKQAEVSSSGAKVVLLDMVVTGDDPGNIAKDKNVIQVSDSNEIEKIVDMVIEANPKAADDIRNGETKVIGFMVGQVMKESKGKANPGLAQELIRKRLS